MRLALMIYHKNIFNLYKPEWVEQCKQSILNQSYKMFDVFELNYNGSEEIIFEDSIYESKQLPTFIHAMNYLLDKLFNLGYDCVGNVNLDDVYSMDWLQVEVPYIKYYGFDIVSCNFSLMKDDLIIHNHKFDTLDIKKELSFGNNVICHPAVLYSRNFLEKNRYVPEEIPIEDLLLWKRTIDNYKFKIVQENLLLHRLHDNSVCSSTNR